MARWILSSFSPRHIAHRVSGALRNAVTHGNSGIGPALWFAVSLILTLSGCGSGSSIPVGPQQHRIKTVFLIVMENHNWTGDRATSVKGSVHAPFINSTLLPMSSYASNYFNPPGNHPSLPNYLWLEAGTNFGIHDDNTPYVHHQSTRDHLVTLLDRKAISWKAYGEGDTGTKCPLHYWHNPFVFFDDVTGSNNPDSAKCIQHVRPIGELNPDLSANSVARYNFIVPGLCHSMHSSCNGADQIAEGDQWLANIVPAILASAAYKDDGVLFVLWDEAKAGDGPLPFFVLSPLAKGGGYSNNILYTHSSVLRTVEEIFAVTPLLGDAANANDLGDLFSSKPF